MYAADFGRGDGPDGRIHIEEPEDGEASGNAGAPPLAVQFVDAIGMADVDAFGTNQNRARVVEWRESMLDPELLAVGWGRESGNAGVADGGFGPDESLIRQ